MPELRLRLPTEATGQGITTEAIYNELTSLCGYRQSQYLEVQQQQPPHIAIVKLVSDCFLSTQGFVIQDVPMFGTIEEAAEEPESQEPDRMSTSQAARSSQSPGRIRSSSPASILPPEKLQAQFRRLQLLAPSLKPGKLATKAPPKVLSYWPTERNADLGSYVSSVATESDSKFDDVRQRLQRAEARKKAQADKIKRPMAARQRSAPGPPPESSGPRVQASQVDVGFRSSPQPAMSSQSQAPSQAPSQFRGGGFGSLVTMSQPTAGAFGDRKKVKKAAKKKRSGFR
jgi:hypothetical protein